MIAEILFFPFMIISSLIAAAIAIIVTAFWIWMIIDCAKRKFKNDTEKIVWIIVIVLLYWIGALIYYILIRILNPKGVSK